MSASETIREKLKSLPEGPGIYMMKNVKNEIIYVGKAKNLKNRVRSYFTGVRSKDLKTQKLVRAISDFEIILTKKENEALLLERTLIRHHHPVYNIMLKDGKEYPYVRVDYNETWPRIEKVRQRKEDGAYYLGPFSNAGYLNTSLKLMGRIFPTIRCSRYEFKTTKRVCNYYHMKMCLGPCHESIERQNYVDMIGSALSFLMGKNKELVRDLKKKMLEASDQENFELAAQLRDQLKALDEISRRQSTVVKSVDDADCIAVMIQDGKASFNILLVREGRVIGNENFIANAPIETIEEVLPAFLLQYYDTRIVPREIFLEQDLSEVSELVEHLGPATIEKTYSTKVSVPQRGPKHDLMEMAKKTPVMD